MTKLLEIYKCGPCGNIIEVLHTGMGELVCCGEPMELLKEQTADSAVEKHVPVQEKTDDGLKVTVGSVPHPMADEHFIEWIQIIDGHRIGRMFLKPGQSPEAVFCACDGADGIVAREYCNIHGLWKG